jgi:predicted nucleic acid-binding Zn ribbon protein
MPDPGRRRDRAPRLLSQAIADVRSQIAPPTLLARAQARWAGAVGTAVAEQAEPISERNGVVTVACRSSTWASELSMLTESLLERLNASLAEGGDEGARASGLKFVVRPS